jgi:hypothetical protein
MRESGRSTGGIIALWVLLVIVRLVRAMTP